VSLLNRLILTIDVSTSGIHISLINHRIEIVSRRFEELKFLSSDVPGVKEIDAVALWKTLLKTIKELVNESKEQGIISEIAVTGQRQGCVFLDKEDNVLIACSNLDARSSNIAATIPLTIKQEIYDITGHWPNHLFPAIRLLWLKGENPILFNQIHRFMMINEWIAYKITGKKKSKSLVEKTNAAESLFFDITNLGWSEKIINYFGMSHLKFPNVVDSGTIVGTIDKEVAQEVGLEDKVQVKIAMADTQSAVLGSGILEEGDIAIVNGSTTPVQLVVNQPLIDVKSRTWTCPYLPGIWVLESNCSETGKMYKKIKNDFQQFILQFDSKLLLSDENLNSIILNNRNKSYDSIGFWGPTIFNVSSEKESKLGLLFSDERVNIFDAILVSYVENLAFAIRANIEQLEEITNIHPRRIILSGGGSRNSLLRVLLPMILENHQLYITNELDTTAIGAAIVGREDQAGVREILSNSVTQLKSKEGNPDFYDMKYALWKKMYFKINED